MLVLAVWRPAGIAAASLFDKLTEQLPAPGPWPGEQLSSGSVEQERSASGELTRWSRVPVGRGCASVIGALCFGLPSDFVLRISNLDLAHPAAWPSARRAVEQ